MARVRFLGLLLLALLAAGRSDAASPDSRTKTHGLSVSGTVEHVDPAAKTFVVRSGSGRTTTLVRTAATKVNGEGLKPGDRVAVRYLERDGKKVATSIRVEPPSVATATATPTATAPATR